MTKTKGVMIILAVFAMAGCHGKKATPAEGEVYYTCSMHPQVIQDKPGNCPICGMRLIKKTRSPEEGKQEAVSKDLREVSLSPMAQILANVAMTEAVKRPLTKTIRTVGVVAFDRELFVAAQEYQSALKLARAAGYGGGAIAKQGRETLSAARDKLELMGMSDEEITAIEATGKVDRSLYFPEKGEPVWINAEIYEQEKEWVREGTSVEIVVDTYPGEIFEGKVVSVTPLVRFPSRSFKARIRITAPTKTLNPEMFANAKLKIDVGEFLAVPASSVINTGDRKAVWVHLGGNRFAPREVSFGARADDYFIVLEGLEEGEHIVSQGGFLLDSEAELRSFGATSEKEETGEKGKPMHHHH